MTLFVTIVGAILAATLILVVLVGILEWWRDERRYRYFPTPQPEKQPWDKRLWNGYGRETGIAFLILSAVIMVLTALTAVSQVIG